MQVSSGEEPPQDLNKNGCKSVSVGLSAAQRALRVVDSRLELQMPILRTATAHTQPPPPQNRSVQQFLEVLSCLQ